MNKRGLLKNKFNIRNNFVVIYCNSRRDNCIYEVILDTDDFDSLKTLNYSIYYHKTKNNRYYAFVTIYKKEGKSKSVMLHKYLLGCTEQDIDHIDGDTRNNRRKNLRLSSRSDNCKNRQSPNRNGTSGYRNVTKMGKMWRVQLQVDGKNKLFPEKFEDVRKAGVFAKKMRKKYYGEYSGKG